MSAPSWGPAPGQWALEAASPQAQQIADLWWLFTWTSTAIWVLVLAATLYALLHRRRPASDTGARPDPGPERSLVIVTGGASLATLLVLFALLVASTRTGQALAAPAPADALRIEVTGQRWWWQIQYPGAAPSQLVTTANELHVPVGRAVSIALSSRDVIHSFWVPALHGKRDLIPGNPTAIHFVAREAGVFRGQCAEFCGLQHAHMGLLVVAEPADRFDAWLAAQRAPAARSEEPLAQRGEQVFLSSSCPLCHGVRGTPAAASRGPDLTHLATRATLAAASLPNAPAELAGWVRDPQAFKLGTLMPTHALAVEDQAPLVAYLMSLK